MKRVRTLLYKLRVAFFVLKGGEDVIPVYIALIVAGRKTFAQVPELLREQVRTELEALELGALVD